MRRKIDLKFIACVLGGFGVLAVGVHFLHGFQMSHSEALLLRQAERAESKEDPGKADYRQAARYLRRYLGYHPDDTDALARWGAALDELAKQSGADNDKAAAYKVLDQVILRAPGRSAVRRRAVELAMHFGEFAHAKNLLEPLIKQLPNDGQLERLMGVCEFAAENYKNAAEWLDKSVKHAPDDLEGYEKLAALYRLRLSEPKKADRLMDEMVAKNKPSPRALLSRARYYKEFHGQDKDAEERIKSDLAAARKMDSRDADVLVLTAAFARDGGDLKEARRLLQSGLAANPKSVELYLGLMAVEVRDGNKAAADVLRRGLRVLPEDWKLLAALADLSLQDGDLTEAKAAVDRLGKAGRTSGPARAARAARAFLEAQILMRQKRWGEAVGLLEGLRLKRGTAAAPAHDVEMLLGRCHERLDNPDQALAAYRQALELKPLTSPARFGVGAVLLSLGRFDEAVASYRDALRFKDAPPRLRLALVRALIARVSQLPEKKRTWAEVKSELARSAEELSGEPEVAVLRAEAQLLEDPGHPERAREALEKARDASPDKAELWLALADVAGRGRPAEAFKVLDDAARRPALQNRLELRLARLRYTAGLPEKEARAALGREEAVILKAEGEDQQRLLAALGDAYLRLGAKRETEEHWGRLVQKQPDNLSLRLVLLDLALDRGAGDADVEQALKHIRRIEGGTGGPFWHFGEAARLFRQAAQKDPPPSAKGALSRARRHLAEVAKLRPSWSRAPALLAEIDALEGRHEEALNNSRRAVRLGDRRDTVLRQYVQFLVGAGPSAEDKQLVGQLADQQEQTLLAAGLGKMVAGVLFTPEDSGRAVALARKAVPPDAKDYRDHLWLGQLLAAAGPQGAGSGWKELAGQAFTRARDLAPKEPATWLALFHFLRATDQKQQADAVLAQSQKALAAADAASVLAPAREAAGDKEGAEKHYLAAVRARPADALLLHNLAAFYLRTGQADRAEPLLQQLLTSSDKDSEGRRAWARRSLALTYAARGNYQHFKKALKAFDDNKKSPGGESAEDTRARATVLATRAEHRKEAIGLLKKLSAEQMLGEADKWLLVRLHDADGDWGQAQAVLMGLLNAPGAKNPAYYAYYVDRLLRKGLAAQAGRWLEKLEQAEPQALGTKVLRARALAARRQDDQAVALLREHAAKHDQDLDQVAYAVENLGAAPPNNNFYFQHAETMYRDLVKRSGKPDSHLKYAAFLGRRGRVREALDECERAEEGGGSEGAGATAVAVLRAGSPGNEDYRRVEGWLRAGAEKGKNPPAFLALLADLNDMRGDYQQAIAYNVEALRHSPDNVVVLNNLAWLLTLKEHKGDEALRLIDRAVVVAGPLPALLDTRGSILLAVGKSRQAVPDLEQAVTLRPTAQGYFRLARALWPENQAAAKFAFRQAQLQPGGLRPENLHPLERRRNQYEQWLQKLAN